MKYLKTWQKRLAKLRKDCSKNLFSRKLKEENIALKERNEKLKTDVFELTKLIFDTEQRLKGKVMPCKKCNGLIYIFKDKVLHDGTCDLDDGIILSMDVLDEGSQKRLKEALKC